MKKVFALLAVLFAALQFATAQNLPSVYFDFDKSSIRPGAEDTLKMVLKTLAADTTLVVEIRGHADARGSEDYNYSLSQRRADNVVAYLVQNGVARNRLAVLSYGESNPVNICVDGIQCSEEKHQENRRVEFRIISTKEGNFPSAPLSAPTVVPSTKGQRKELSFWTLLMFVPLLLIAFRYLSSMEG